MRFQFLKTAALCLAFAATPVSAVESTTSVTESDGFVVTTVDGTTFASVSSASAETVPMAAKVFANASIGGSIAESLAWALMTYTFHVDLPNFVPSGEIEVIIPARILWSGGFGGSNGGADVAEASGSLSVTGNTFNNTAFDTSFGGNISGSGDYSVGGNDYFSLLYYSLAGGGTYQKDWTIQLYTYVHAATGAGVQSASLYAWLDPTVSFTPEFMAMYPDATITVEALAPVPEASEWAMMAAGLGIVGAVARRRKA